MEFSIDPGSAFIAVLALFVSIHSAWETRKHSRLTVTPRLTTSTHGDSVSDDHGSTLQVSFTLANVGLGPAIVKAAEVLLDGVVVPATSSEDVRALLQHTFPGARLGPTVFFMKLNKEHAIAAGNVLDIVEFTMTNAPSDARKQLERFAIVVRYESLYGEPFTYDSRDHLSA